MRISGYALRLAAFCNTLTGGANLNFALRFLFPYFFFSVCLFLGGAFRPGEALFFFLNHISSARQLQPDPLICLVRQSRTSAGKAR